MTACDGGKFCCAFVEASCADNVFIGDGGVGEQRVLGSERLVDVGVLNSGGIDFKRFDDHTTEGGEVGGDSFRTKDVENENAWSWVDFIIKGDKVVIIGESLSGRTRDEGPGIEEVRDSGTSASEGGDFDFLRGGWFGRTCEEEGKVSGAGIIVLRLEFTSTRDESLVGSVRVGEPGGESIGRVTMLENVDTRGFGDDLGKRFRHGNDGPDDGNEVVEDSSEFIQVVGRGGKEDIVGVEGGGFLEVGRLEIERGERGATVEITEQHGVENGRENLIPFTSSVDGRDVGCTIGVNSEDISAGDEGLARNVVSEELEQLTGEEILLDVGGFRVAGHGCDAVMEMSEEIDRNEATKEVVDVESSSGGNEENVFGAVGFGGGELCEDGFHRVGNGEGEQVFSELVFPGDG